jgi:acyl-[acyl-carrier-protein]-phospholipid O-acyltransferase/long-chain-fatty-acid--[acyl-carrier-protein] ligase
MVPHETVEQKILAALQLGNEGDRTLAVTSVVDAQKGEALVLLSTIEIDQAQLRTRLQEAGMPNLWIPKKIRRVEQIPVLATGKLDLRGCSTIAAQEADGA